MPAVVTFLHCCQRNFTVSIFSSRACLPSRTPRLGLSSVSSINRAEVSQEGTEILPDLGYGDCGQEALKYWPWRNTRARSFHTTIKDVRRLYK
jgi:hypothetical protein